MLCTHQLYCLYLDLKHEIDSDYPQPSSVEYRQPCRGAWHPGWADYQEVKKLPLQLVTRTREWHTFTGTHWLVWQWQSQVQTLTQLILNWSGEGNFRKWVENTKLNQQNESKYNIEVWIWKQRMWICIQLQIPPVCCNGLVIFANTNILIYWPSSCLRIGFKNDRLAM